MFWGMWDSNSLTWGWTCILPALGGELWTTGLSGKSPSRESLSHLPKSLKAGEPYSLEVNPDGPNSKPELLSTMWYWEILQKVKV